MTIRHEFFKAESPEELVTRLRSLIGEYRSISSTHITWFTHKNPYGCWICDILLDLETFCNYMENHLSEPKGENSARETYITTKSSRLDDMSCNSHDSNQEDMGW